MVGGNWHVYHDLSSFGFCVNTCMNTIPMNQKSKIKKIQKNRDKWLNPSRVVRVQSPISYHVTSAHAATQANMILQYMVPCELMKANSFSKCQN